MIKLYEGDCLDILKKFPANHFDTLITDPPYGLEFMGKDWDRGIPGVRFWKEFLRVCRPGAFALVFGGTRTFHRLTCAMEDAGWIIRDCMMWLYGSGFPKSHDISKAIDKAKRREYVLAALRIGMDIPSNSLHDWTKAEHSPSDKWWAQFKAYLSEDDWMTVEREVVGKQIKARKTDCKIALPTTGNTEYQEWNITNPATELAKQWHGYGTALKPAWEPIIVAMKPLDGTFAHNAEKWGVGGLWIDGGRIGVNGGGTHCNNRNNVGKCLGHPDRSGTAFGLTYHSDETTTLKGRWPANLILSHTPDCKKTILGKSPALEFIRQQENVPFVDDGKSPIKWECSPDCPVRLLDEQSGVSKSNPTRKNKGGVLNTGSSYGQGIRKSDWNGPGDSGGASRFFYCAKASRSERNAGLGGMEAKVSRTMSERNPDNSGNSHNTTGQKPAMHQNNHPTVKPLKLMEYLCKLTRTPTGGIVLDPFAGSGTTGLACMNTGRDCVLIEKEPAYCEIIRGRVKGNAAKKN